jgi:hypothetical protein
MRLALPGRRAEIHARALRDQLADLEVTLPALLARGEGGAASLHAWFAGLDGVRALLCPALPRAYAAWRRGDGGAALHAAIAAGRTHLGALADEALALHRAAPGSAGAAIESLLASPRAVCGG